MAWKAPGSWKTPLTLPKNNDDSTFPGLQPASSPEVHTKIEYDELQQNEILALGAIYGEDFVMHPEAQSAWKVSRRPPPTSGPKLTIPILREPTLLSIFASKLPAMRISPSLWPSP